MTSNEKLILAAKECALIMAELLKQINKPISACPALVNLMQAIKESEKS